MDMTDKAQDGYSKFEEAVHELEQAAAERQDGAVVQARHAGSDGLSALCAAVRSRPASSLLIACLAGYALARLADPR